MFLFVFNVIPSPSNEFFDDIAGAYALVYTPFPDDIAMSTAEQAARQIVEKQNWEIQEKIKGFYIPEELCHAIPAHVKKLLETHPTAIEFSAWRKGEEPPSEPSFLSS